MPLNTNHLPDALTASASLMKTDGLIIGQLPFAVQCKRRPCPYYDNPGV